MASSLFTRSIESKAELKSSSASLNNQISCQILDFGDIGSIVNIFPLSKARIAIISKGRSEESRMISIWDCERNCMVTQPFEYVNINIKETGTQLDITEIADNWLICSLTYKRDHGGWVHATNCLIINPYAQLSCKFDENSMVKLLGTKFLAAQNEEVGKIKICKWEEEATSILHYATYDSYSSNPDIYVFSSNKTTTMDAAEAAAAEESKARREFAEFKAGLYAGEATVEEMKAKLEFQLAELKTAKTEMMSSLDKIIDRQYAKKALRDAHWESLRGELRKSVSMPIHLKSGAYYNNFLLVHSLPYGYATYLKNKESEDLELTGVSHDELNDKCIKQLNDEYLTISGYEKNGLSYVTIIFKFQSDKLVNIATIANDTYQYVIGCFESRLAMFSPENYVVTIYNLTDGCVLAKYHLSHFSSIEQVNFPMIMLDNGTIAFAINGLGVLTFRHQVEQEMSLISIARAVEAEVRSFPRAIAENIAAYVGKGDLTHHYVEFPGLIKFLHIILHPGYWESLGANPQYIRRIRATAKRDDIPYTKKIMLILGDVYFMKDNILKTFGIYDFFVHRYTASAASFDLITETLLNIPKRATTIPLEKFKVLYDHYDGWCRVIKGANPSIRR